MNNRLWSIKKRKKRKKKIIIEVAEERIQWRHKPRHTAARGANLTAVIEIFGERGHRIFERILL